MILDENNAGVSPIDTHSRFRYHGWIPARNAMNWKI